MTGGAINGARALACFLISSSVAYGKLLHTHDSELVITVCSKGAAGGARERAVEFMRLVDHDAVTVYSKCDACPHVTYFQEQEGVTQRCVHTPNYDGRDAHTILLHIVTKYRSLATLTYFKQDDIQVMSSTCVLKEEAYDTRTYFWAKDIEYFFREYLHSSVEKMNAQYFPWLDGGAQLYWMNGQEFNAYAHEIRARPRSDYEHFLRLTTRSANSDFKRGGHNHPRSSVRWSNVFERLWCYIIPEVCMRKCEI